LFAVDDSVWFTGAVRGCGTATMMGCSALTSQPVPELHLTDATGELCYCSGNLCNSAPQTSVRYSGMVVVTAVSFTVAASFLALTTDRFLSQ